MFWLFIFIISFVALFWSGSRLVRALMRIAKYLGWREFVVAFFVMAFAASLPNFFVGINSALNKIPELSFGEIVGGNVICLTIAVALAVFVSGVSLPAESRMVQTSAIFTAITAILPLILIIDGKLGRGDGLILVLTFAVYVFWLFSKEERFTKIYANREEKIIKGFKQFLKDIGKIAISLILLLLASEGIVRSAQVFSTMLKISLPTVGILIVGLGNALPEIYFGVVSARKKQSWMVLGDLMGSIIITATFVLGIVVLIYPIENIDFSPLVIARIFLIISAIFFLIVIRTGQKITKKEAIFLLLIYISFIAAEIIFR